jgi:hypothetical protein
MAALASLSTAPLDQSRQVEWCLLFLEHLNDFATLTWYLVANGRLVEHVILRALTRLGSISFDTSLPLLTYNQARDMLITEAIATTPNLGLDQHYDGPVFVEPASHCELPDLRRLAFLLGQRLPSSLGTKCYDA